MDVNLCLTLFYEQAVDDPRIGTSHISLYMALLQHCKQTGGTNPFPIYRDAVMKTAKINARYTYNKCINNLNDYGYISYVRSSNSSRQSTIRLKFDNQQSDGNVVCSK